MRGHLAYAEGSPSTTLVLSAADLPSHVEELPQALRPVRRWLADNGLGALTKIALIAPSDTVEPGIAYRFVQLLPGKDPGIELRGSCGHSILSALIAAARYGWVPRLGVGRSYQVDVLNNGDRVACEIEGTAASGFTIGAHFLRTPPVSAREMLPTGEGTTLVAGGTPGAPPLPVSIVSAGNPYVFVDGADLGVRGADQLFADDPALFETMSSLRRQVAHLLGWPLEGAFPKIAAVLREGAGHVAVRAISVPSWHPTVAITGAVCTAGGRGHPRHHTGADGPRTGSGR
ncbi:hypothetical protein GXW82_08805 [Streptacidiphilus sp. 4-A2]|nr:hypothetical protein [Streptacidiphilus sp. 4-A2]